MSVSSHLINFYFCFQKCEKKYDSKGGLTRHIRAKNEEGKENSATSELFAFMLFPEFFNSVKENLLGEKCYPDPIRSKIISFCRPGTHFYLKSTIWSI